MTVNTCSNLLPAVIVLNSKYLPQSIGDAAQVGASSFSLSVIRILLSVDKLQGIVLYRRDEGITSPHRHVECRGSVPVVTVSFNFHMPRDAITQALSDAFLETRRLDMSANSLLPSMIYYQTDSLLHFHPSGQPFCITHHGPFVADIARLFTRKKASLAFGGAEKIEILEQQQRRGLARLTRDNDGYILAHSAVSTLCVHRVSGQCLVPQSKLTLCVVASESMAQAERSCG